jgi:hypothetical protein
VSWISEPCGLTTENGLAEGVVEEGVLHIKLLNWRVTGDSSSKHRADGGRFHNRAESLVVVDPRTLSETPEDPAGFVAIKRPIDTKLVHENPLVGNDIGATGPGDKLPGPIAHQSPVLVLHSVCQLGSASAARTKVGIGDGVDGDDEAARTKRSGSTRKPALARVSIQ